MKTLLAVLFLSALCFADTTCQSNFRSGNGNGQSVINFCVTANGNIAYVNTGVVMIQGGPEGYAVCGIGAQYWDLGLYGDSGNWQPSVITQPGGPNTFPLAITRTSADGYITLKQEFSFGTGKKSIHVKMTLGSPSGTAPRLYRFADVEGQDGDHGLRSSFIWTTGSFGLMAYSAATANTSGGLMLGGPPADICTPTVTPTHPYVGDSATLLGWSVGKSGVVAFDYLPMR